MIHNPIHIEASLAYSSRIIFDKLHLTLVPNNWTCILGKSGSGKTSLLRLLAGLIPSNIQTKHTIDVTGISLQTLRANLSFMQQQDSLLPWLTVTENILLPAKLSGKKSSSHNLKVKEILNFTELHDAEKLYPHQLSGGMRQRAVLARILFENKPIILLDEPFSALDAITRHAMQKLAQRSFENKIVLLITHDPMEAIRLAHHIYLLKNSTRLSQFRAQHTPMILPSTDATFSADSINTYHTLLNTLAEI